MNWPHVQHNCSFCLTIIQNKSRCCCVKYFKFGAQKISLIRSSFLILDLLCIEFTLPTIFFSFLLNFRTPRFEGQYHQPFVAKSKCPVVNFINILRTNFMYESLFGSFFYLHVTREKLPKRCSYLKFVCKMLIKLTPGCRCFDLVITILRHSGSTTKLRPT